MTSFVDPERFKSAPVRLDIRLYVDREFHDKICNAAIVLGFGSVERMTLKLLEKVVEDLEAQGYDLRSNWMKKVVGEV